MSTLEILIAARELIADEKNWCQKKPSAGIGGYVTHVMDEHAESWCAWGAINRVIGREGSFEGAWLVLTQIMGTGPIHFNDTHTHAEVLAAFDRAIASLQETFVPVEWELEKVAV